MKSKPKEKFKITEIQVISLGFLLIIAIYMINDYYISKKVYVPTDSEYSSNSASKAEFIAEVKMNDQVIDADITDVNVLYISSPNDGKDKQVLADLYCKWVKNYNIQGVNMVKVVDSKTANLPKNGTAWGDELGKCFCN
ncbi:hypothetical protein [Aquirufa aurantiipilula]